MYSEVRDVSKCKKYRVKTIYLQCSEPAKKCSEKTGRSTDIWWAHKLKLSFWNDLVALLTWGALMQTIVATKQPSLLWKLDQNLLGCNLQAANANKLASFTHVKWRPFWPVLSRVSPFQWIWHDSVYMHYMANYLKATGIPKLFVNNDTKCSFKMSNLPVNRLVLADLF